VLGRGPHCAVILEDTAVSWDHVEITRHGDALIACDLDSRNGTVLNGERLSGSRRLRHGDMLQIGPFRLEVSLPTSGGHQSTAARPSITPELTEDEREVSRALVQPYLSEPGLAGRPATRAEIGEALNMSVRTVQRRLDSLASKLGIEGGATWDRPRLIADRIIALGLHQRR